MADLKQIYKLFDKAGVLDKTIFEIQNRDIPLIAKRDGKQSVTYRNAVDTLNAGLAVRDVVRKGPDSEMPVKGLNMLGKAISRHVGMDPRFKVEGTGTPNNPGAKGSVPMGPGRAGLVLPNFKDTKSMRAFYEDRETRVDVNRDRISAQRNLGNVGPLTLSGEAYATKRGPGGKPDMGAMLRGKMKFAKGGHVKQYSNAPRKPRLK
tara:strand:+ start:37 stop:654 length:618 start_codon:yes stop_codon:yes gene_type:complete